MLRARMSLCLYFSIVLTASCESMIESNSTDFISVDKVIFCVEKIAEDYFARKENVLIISAESVITGEILRRMEPRFGINLANKNSRINFGAILDYVVLADESGMDPYDAVENMILNPRGRYVIVTREKPEVLETGAARFWRAGIPDVIFVKSWKGVTATTIFGYEISPRYPNSTRLCVLDSWDGEFLNRSNLFPNKFKDMENRPLRVTVLNTRQMEPEIYVTRENGELKINGVGSTLVNLFAEKLNFKMSVKENFYYGHKEKDGTWTGPPGQLIRGDADLSFLGILPTTKSTGDLEYTDFYRWDALHFVMKIRGKTVSWKSVFKPLSLAVWISQLLVLTMTLCLVFIVKKFRSANIIEEYIRYIDILRVLCNQSVRYPKYDGIRLAFALWLIYGYLTTASYTGSLVTYLSMPSYRENPNTFEELEKSDIEIGGPVPIKLLLGRTGDPVERRIHDRFVNLTYTNFWQIMAEKDRAIVMYRTTAILNNWINRKNESKWLHVLEDPIIGIPLFYYMKKGHPYREPLSHFIRQIHSSGLITKWMADFNARNAEQKYEQESVVLTLEHLAGVFLILLCGYVIGIVRFFCELYQG